jgi:hypothetical protein
LTIVINVVAIAAHSQSHRRIWESGHCGVDDLLARGEHIRRGVAEAEPLRN